MKKRLSVICFAFLGLVNIQDAFAGNGFNRGQDLEFVDKGSFKNTKTINKKSKNRELSNGIMKDDFVLDIKKQKKERAENDARMAVRKEKEIEVNSVNFLKFERKIGEIFIPNSDIADIEMLSDRSLYLSGLKEGVTSLVIHDKEGKVLGDYVIRVTYPLRDIKGAIAKIFPDLELDLVSIDNNLILKGDVESPEMAQDVLNIVERFIDKGKIINKMTIETATQVLLKVKIAEVTRDITKSIGVDWRTLSAPGGGSAGLIGMAVGNSTSLPEFSSDVAKDVLDNTLTVNTDGGKWIVAAGVNNLAALIDAAAKEAFATILAEPNLVALSGQSATFKSGGEYGYTVNQGDSSSNKTTEFKNWGTSLEFTPVVLSEDRINIKVKTEVSALSQKSGDEEGPPNLSNKTVETVVELGSGQSIVLAGLLQRQSSSNSTETPFLAEIPLIGSLFRSASIDTKEQELVIIVTPYIVKPSSKQLKTPTDMVPKILSPLNSITKRRFNRLGKEADSAGFSLK